MQHKMHSNLIAFVTLFLLIKSSRMRAINIRFNILFIINYAYLS